MIPICIFVSFRAVLYFLVIDGMLRKWSTSLGYLIYGPRETLLPVSLLLVVTSDET